MTGLLKFAVIGCFCAALSQAQAPPAAGQPATPAAAAPIGGMNLNNAPLLQVIDTLAQELKISYVLDASVKGGNVTVNTYGPISANSLRPLLETVLRMNNLSMVQVGDLYRIVPAVNVARQPVAVSSQTDPSKIPDDERLILNLIFLRYMNAAEMLKILSPFAGDGAQVTTYDPANVLIVLDNSRNMRRTMDLVAMFDSDTFAGQRVRTFEVKNGAPSAIVKELDQVFKQYSFGAAKSSAVQFLALERINTILAVAPNPGVFTEVEKWLTKLDVPAKVAAGAVDNYVYKLKYGKAEILGSVITQLYGGQPYPGVSESNDGYGASRGTNMGNPLGTSGIPASSPFGGNAGGNGVLQGGSATPQSTQGANARGPSAASLAGFGAPDQTGTFLSGVIASQQNSNGGPRIIPNPFDNTLLVQSTPEQWEQISTLLDKLDVSPRQVLIDARIYEVTLTGELSAGVQAFLQRKGSAYPTGIAGRQLTGLTSAAGSLLSAGLLVGQSRELLGLLQTNEMSTKSKVVSAPSIIATDSIPASITVGSSVPTLSSQGVNPGVQQNGSSVFTNTISNTSTGVGLNILARVTPSGIVTMVIDQSVTAPIPTTSSSINSPSFSQRNVSTQVTVDDGDTIAIGGIIDESNTEASSGIPGLHRIPYLGAIFGSKTYTKARTELVIFLTPHVIYDTNKITDATEELRRKMKGLSKIIAKDEK